MSEQPSEQVSKVKIPVGISGCLLGERVRFNGGHKRFRLCSDDWSRWFDFQSVCPEMGIGMGVPRPPVRLVETRPGHIDIVDPESARTYTREIQSFTDSVENQLSHLCGFVLAAKSPSCGLQGVKVYLPNGHPNSSGRGIFADTLIRKYPLLPVEDSGRLMDAGLRENFVLRVFVYHSWRLLVQRGLTPQRLTDFHARHKFLVLAHQPAAYKTLGQLLANCRHGNLSEVANEYIHGLMAALAKPASRGGHSNALMHIQGYLKTVLKPEERQALRQSVDHYHSGDVPLVVPMTLIRHYVDKHTDVASYAARQAYLAPYPTALRLRNQI